MLRRLPLEVGQIKSNARRAEFREIHLAWIFSHSIRNCTGIRNLKRTVYRCKVNQELVMGREVSGAEKEGARR